MGVLVGKHCSVIPYLGSLGVGISRLVSRQAEISRGKLGEWDPQRAEKQALRKPVFAVRSANDVTPYGVNDVMLRINDVTALP